jgi:outer membrane protein assembly factor BamE (lipoprotein component of BamABCDE complex)
MGLVLVCCSILSSIPTTLGNLFEVQSWTLGEIVRAGNLAKKRFLVNLVTPGMSPDQVRRLLGPPTMTSGTGGGGRSWSYWLCPGDNWDMVDITFRRERGGLRVERVEAVVWERVWHAEMPSHLSSAQPADLPKRSAACEQLCSLGNLLQGLVLVGQVREGMTEHQVEELLGPAFRISGNLRRVDWYYPACGVRVSFENARRADDGHGDVTRVSATRWSFDWPR